MSIYPFLGVFQLFIKIWIFKYIDIFEQFSSWYVDSFRILKWRKKWRTIFKKKYFLFLILLALSILLARLDQESWRARDCPWWALDWLFWALEVVCSWWALELGDSTDLDSDIWDFEELAGLKPGLLNKQLSYKSFLIERYFLWLLLNLILQICIYYSADSVE